jgi:hypothetical protein
MGLALLVLHLAADEGFEPPKLKVYLLLFFSAGSTAR